MKEMSQAHKTKGELKKLKQFNCLDRLSIIKETQEPIILVELIFKIINLSISFIDSNGTIMGKEFKDVKFFMYNYMLYRAFFIDGVLVVYTSYYIKYKES